MLGALTGSGIVEEWKGGIVGYNSITLSLPHSLTRHSGRPDPPRAYWDNGRLARCEERIALTDFGYSTTPYPTNGDPMAFLPCAACGRPGRTAAGEASRGHQDRGVPRGRDDARGGHRPACRVVRLGGARRADFASRASAALQPRDDPASAVRLAVSRLTRIVMFVIIRGVDPQ